MKNTTLIAFIIAVGFLYGASWFVVVYFASWAGLVVPMSWIEAIILVERLSEGTQIFLIRSLWAAEFAIHLFASAILVAWIIVRFHTNAGVKTIVAISLIAIISTAPLWFIYLPRYVPIFFSIPYIVVLFAALLLLAVVAIRHITKPSTGRGVSSGPAKPGLFRGRAG